MRRRLRITVIALVVGLGIPLLIALGTVIFVATGGLERRVEAEFAAHLPGRLRVGRIEMAGLGRALAHDVHVFADSGGEPIARIGTATIEGNLLGGDIQRIVLDALQVRVEPDTIAWVRALASERTATGQRSTGLVVEASGVIAIAQRLLFRDLVCTLTFANGGIDGSFAATLGGEPVAITLVSEAVAGADHRHTQVTCAALTIPTADALATLSGLAVLDVPRQLLGWLPEETALAGSTVRIDGAALDLAGTVVAVWSDGRLDATLHADRDRVALAPLMVADDGLGSAEGSITVAYADRSLRLDLSQWHPGPRLGIPAAVPIDDLLVLLPHAGLEVVGGDAPRVSARFHNAANTAWITGSWEPDAPIRVDGGGVPLRIAQRYLPASWTIREGAVTGLSMVWDQHLRRGLLEVADLDLGVGAWTMDDLAGTITIDPVDDNDGAAGMQVRLDLPFAALIHRGVLPGGELELTIADMAGLAERLSGPVPVPTCAGFLKLIADLETAPDGTWAGRVRHFGVAGFTIDGLVRDVAIAAKGRYAWTEAGVEAVVDGQLHAAEVGLPGRWINLATQRPRFTATVASSGNGVAVRDVLARAAEVDGTPIPAGFTAGMQGQLDGGLSGRIDGVIDRIDLTWLSDRLGLVPMPPASTLAGESAVTWAVTVADGRVTGLEGVTLPLGVDLGFLGGDIRIEGISGAARFSLQPIPPPEPAP